MCDVCDCDDETLPAVGSTTADAEKLDFIYSVALEAKKLIDEVHPQIAPILAGLEKNPMLKMFLKK